MPAQSPTLSPTLSAMVAALRGSSSGMPASTLPTRSAPTSAALVKMPPPTRMNRASSEAPKPKPMSTEVAVFWKTKHDDGGAEQAEAHAEQAGDGAGAVGHLEGGRHLPLPGGGRGAHVAPHGQAHADEAGQARAQGAGQEADRPGRCRPAAKVRSVTVWRTTTWSDRAAADGDQHVGHGVGHLGGREEDEHGQGDDDDPDGLELAGQEGLGPLLDGLGDVLHRGGALVGGQDAPHQQQRRPRWRPRHRRARSTARSSPML